MRLARYATLVLFIWLVLGGSAVAAPLKVVGRFLQDANGHNAMIRGVNIPVYKSGYADDLDAVAAAVSTTRVNAVRLEWWATPAGPDQYTVAKLDRAIQKFADLGILPIVELHDLTYVYGQDYPSGANSQGNDKVLFANTITAFWTRPDVLAVLVKHQDHLVVNLANEWGTSTYHDGSPTTTNFIQNYSTAMTAMRTAGINAPLMVDAPKGFEYQFLLDHGQAILDADPQKNVMLSAHAYWDAAHYSDGAVNTILAAIANSGLPIVLGEFSSNAYTTIPCDPIHYANLLSTANSAQIGYVAWAWYEDGQCGQAMNITVGSDGVTVPTAAQPGFGYDVLNGSGYGINTAQPATVPILGNSKILTAGRALANWPAGIPPGEKRPVLVFLPGWGGVGAMDAAVSAQNSNLQKEGYVTLAIGFDSAATWISDIDTKTLQGLNKLCADASIPANCNAIALMGESYGSAQNYWVIESLRSNGYGGGAGSTGRALAFLSEDSGYGAPGTLTDPNTGAFTRTGLADTTAYAVAMIENLGDSTFPVDLCTWGNCGARVLSNAHLARGDTKVLSICPPGGEHGTRGFADWDAWVASAIKTLIHVAQGVPTFTGYSGPSLAVSNACAGAGAAQTISPGTAPTVKVNTTGTVSATASSGLPVSFSAAPGSVSICSLSGTTVTGLAQGICTIYANQAGNATYAAAPQAVIAFTVLPPDLTTPSPPTITSIDAGAGWARINFNPPANTGGAAITSYTASCSAPGQTTRTVSGASSPLVVWSLNAGVLYSCTVTASNGSYTSAASVAASVTPQRALDITPILMLLLLD